MPPAAQQLPSGISAHSHLAPSGGAPPTQSAPSGGSDVVAAKAAGGAQVYLVFDDEEESMEEKRARTALYRFD